MKEIYKHLFGLPKEEWEARLPGMCENDEELYNHLQCLLNMPPGFLGREAPRPCDCTDIYLSPGEVLAGRWQIVESLGSGGMADVYAADDRELNKRVALKLIRSDISFDNSVLDRFRKEVDLAQKVRHRNVCAVYDIGRDHRGSRDIVFLTMQLIPGETMAERLRRTGPLDPSEWFPVAEQLCNAIQEAHYVKVLHRDFKPGNVMLVGTGKDIRAIVTDFGIARAIGGDQDPALGLTARSILIGTWPYMSPEQKRGEDLSETSDIYSLGLVLYEMITGKQYFQFPQLDNVPKEGDWRHVIQQCLEEDPAKRFQAALEVLDAINLVPPPPPPPPPVWKILRITAAVAVAVVLAVTITSFMWRPEVPRQMRVAIVPFETTSKEGLDRRVDGLSEEAVGKLNNPRDPNLSVVLMTDTIGITENEVPSAAKRLGFSHYIAGTIKKEGSQFKFDIRLKEVSSKRVLRSAGFSTDSASGLAREIARLLEHPEPQGQDDTLSHNRQARDFYYAGIGSLLHLDVAHINDAIDEFEKAISEDPQFADAYAYLAFAHSLKYRKTRDLASMAKVTWAQARLTDLNRDLPLTHLAVGVISLDIGNFDGAITDFEIALAHSPANREARSLLAMAYLESGKIDEAKQLLRKAIERDPLDWFNHNDLGYVYVENGELAEAESEFQEAVKLASENPNANANLAGICICFGKYQQSEAISKHILASRKSATADLNLAKIYEQQGRYPSAIQLLEDATQLKGMIDLYWLELGEAYKLQKMRTKAAESFTKARELAQDNFRSRPNDSELLVRIALYNAELGSRAAALSQLEQAQRMAEKRHLSEEFLINSARVYELAGKRTQALNVLRSVLHNRCASSEAEITPDFASLRSDHRYKEIISQASLQQKL